MPDISQDVINDLERRLDAVLGGAHTSSLTSLILLKSAKIHSRGA